MAAGVNMGIFTVMLIIFIIVTVVLGMHGYKHTKQNQHFLLGRNKATSLLVGISYGATFLSTSAIIGFGGQAANHGLVMMWLVFLNLFLGLMLPFILFAPKVRKIGRKVGASTMADLFGKIFRSKGIRGFIAGLIVVMMPIYAAAVLKGGVNALVTITNMTDLYDLVLIVVAVVVGLYVVYGGVIAVMYNDVLQAAIMVVGMVIIFAVTIFTIPGGFTGAVDIISTIPPTALPGATSLISMPTFLSEEWWLVISTFILGVGIGAMTQPQLVVRFMSAKNDKMLSHSMIVGSIFTLIIVGTAYTTGALTNAYFMTEFGKTSAQMGFGTDFIIPQYVLHIFEGVNFGDIFVCAFVLSLLAAAVSTLSALMHAMGAAGGHDLYAVYKERNVRGNNGSISKVTSPVLKAGYFFISIPDRFREKKEEIRSQKEKDDAASLRVNRSVTAICMVLVVVYCYLMPNDIIAKATSLFMGMTAAALLPLLIYGLYSKRPKKQVVIPSIIVGTITYLFWALFINSGSSIFLPICNWITGQKVLVMEGTLQFVDSLAIALPLSALTMMIMLLIYRNKKTAEDAEEEKC